VGGDEHGCGLVNITPDGQSSGMRQSWEVSPDGLTYTFKLHDNILPRWHQSEAAAVKFSIERLKIPKPNPA
jgi:ABC-type transport system substrate-binding protein